MGFGGEMHSGDDPFFVPTLDNKHRYTPDDFERAAQILNGKKPFQLGSASSSNNQRTIEVVKAILSHSGKDNFETILTEDLQELRDKGYILKEHLGALKILLSSLNTIIKQIP
jgi:hypothetical protein